MSDNILDSFVRIRPCQPMDVAVLERVAAEDNHSVICATDVIEKHGEIVGYLSLGAIPTVLTWMHSKKMQVRDTLQVINFYENLFIRNNQPGVLLPVMTNSPLYPFPTKVGYTKACDATLFVKPFNQGVK